MKDTQKNLLVMVIITIIIISISHYYELGFSTWILELAGIVIWLIVTPYKLYEDV